MNTWEYKIYRIDHAKPYELHNGLLAEFGKDRWELVSVYEGEWIFKRVMAYVD